MVVFVGIPLIDVKNIIQELKTMRNFNQLKIAVAGTGYVGLSIATLLSQHHDVTAEDVIPEKVWPQA